MDKVIVIVGPTAVGKTNLSIQLAKMLNTEIISGDSMLVYRGLNIGTAKPSFEEREGILHHLIDILPPDAEYSVATFQSQAANCIKRINQKNKIPVLVGGTGLYIKALLEGFTLGLVGKDDAFREQLNRVADLHGEDVLYEKLEAIDSLAAAKIHQNDRRRIIRALEINHLTGKSAATKRDFKQEDLLYDVVVIGLTMERSLLYERINERVDIMLATGLVEEVKQQLDAGITPNCQSMQGIGYKEMIDYLEGKSTLDFAVHSIKQATRHFAKRQLTWFRRMPYIKWYDMNSSDNTVNVIPLIYKQVAGKFFLQ